MESFNIFLVNIVSDLASKISKAKYRFNKYLKQKVIHSFLTEFRTKKSDWKTYK